MLSFGEQLYRLTLRDEETILVAPLFRDSGAVTVLAGVPTGVWNVPVPVDRCVYVHGAVFDLAAEAGTTWTHAEVSAEVSPGVFHVVRRVPFTPVANTRQLGQLDVGLVLPPAARAVRVNAQRTGTANAASFTAALTAYLIPPGRIARA